MTTLLNSSRNGGLIRKPFLRKILALALMGAALALFLCAAGGLSYGDSARSKPSILTVETHYYPTFGTPNDALVTADDAYVLVSVSGATGVQVFRNSDFTNPCGGQQILNFPRPAAWRTEDPCKQLTECNFFRVRRKSALVPQLRRTALNFFVWLV